MLTHRVEDLPGWAVRHGADRHCHITHVIIFISLYISFRSISQNLSCHNSQNKKKLKAFAIKSSDEADNDNESQPEQLLRVALKIIKENKIGLDD